MFVGYRVGSGSARSIRQWWEAPVFTERTSVGLDVHARSVVAAAIDGVTGDLPLQAFNHAVWQSDSDLSELAHHSDR